MSDDGEQWKDDPWRKPMMKLPNDPKTCPHAWEPHLWERDRRYCPLCGSFQTKKS